MLKNIVSGLEFKSHWCYFSECHLSSDQCTTVLHEANVAESINRLLRAFLLLWCYFTANLVATEMSLWMSAVSFNQELVGLTFTFKTFLYLILRSVFTQQKHCRMTCYYFMKINKKLNYTIQSLAQLYNFIWILLNIWEMKLFPPIPKVRLGFFYHIVKS